MNVTAGNRLINHGLADTKFIVNSGKVTVSGKNIGGVASTIDSDVVEINGGEITVGDGANANYIDGYESVTMTGGTLTIKKGAHVAVGYDETNQKQFAMNLNGGTVNLAGMIRASGITDTNATKPGVINIAGATVKIGAADDSAVIQAKTTNLSAGAIENKGKLLLNTALTISGTGKFTNEGTVNVAANGDVNAAGDFTVAGGTVMNAGTIEMDVGTKLVVSDGGVVNTGLASKTQGNFTFTTLTLGEKGTFNVTDHLTTDDSVNTKAAYLNDVGHKLADNTLLLDGVELNFEGGALTYKGASKVNAAFVDSEVNFTQGDYALGAIETNGTTALKIEQDEDKKLNLAIDTLTVDSTGDNEIADGTVTIGTANIKEGLKISGGKVAFGTANVGEVPDGDPAALALTHNLEITAGEVSYETLNVGYADGEDTAVGTVMINGTAKVVAGKTNVTKDSSLGISGGTADLGAVEVKGTATITGGDVTMSTVTVGNGASVTVSAGKVAVTAAEKGINVAKAGTNGTPASGSFTLSNSATLETATANLLKYTAPTGTETVGTYALVDGVNVTGGNVELTDTVDYTADEWTAMHSAISSASLVLTEGTLKSVDANGNKVTASWADVNTVGNAAKSEVLYKDWDATTAITATNDVTMGSLAVTLAEGKTAADAITIGATGADVKTITLRGDANGDVLKLDSALKAKNTVTLGNVNFGAKVEDKGTINNALVLNGTTDVTGTFAMTKGVKVGATTATLNVKKDSALTITGGLDFADTGDRLAAVGVEGDLTADWMTDRKGGVTVKADGAFALLGNKPAEETAVAAAATTPANPYEGALVPGMIEIAADATGAVLSLGADLAVARAAIAKIDVDQETRNVVYIAKQIDNNGASFAPAKTDFIVDLAGVAATEGFKAEEGVVNGSVKFASEQDNKGVVYLQNLTANALVTDEETGSKSLKLTSKTDSSSFKIDFGTRFYDATLVNANNLTSIETRKHTLVNGAVAVAANEGLVKAIYDDDDRIGQVLTDTLNNAAFGQNELIDRIVWGSDAFFDAVNEAAAAIEVLGEDGDEVDAAETQKAQKAFVKSQLELLNETTETVALSAVAGGAFSTAVDINNENSKALARRMSAASGIERADGINVWVDVVGTTNEAKNLYGDNQGYEADIYGAVFGADWTAPCGAIVGAALNIGQADANSVGGVVKVENDVDYYGFTVYGAHQVGLVNGMFDIGYTKVKNDISMNTVIGGFSEKLDGDLFTVGLGAEYLAKAGAVNVVPHAGIRYTRVDMDNSKFGTKYDAMGLFQMPIGVTFSSAFETAGWTLAPKFDITVVPAFGDKDAEFDWYGATDSVRVVDSNPVQATLGLSAQTGAWTFGVNYSLTAGSNDRMNNSFSANARYTF